MKHREMPRQIHEIIDSPEKRAAFRIAIFGTGSESTKEDQMAIENSKKIAEKAIENGFSISTGGYDSGVMKAASEAAAEKAKKLGRKTEDLIKGFIFSKKYPEKPVVKNAEIKRSKSLTERLKHLIDESKAFVVLGGKIGTVVELITTIQSENVQQIQKEKSLSRPIIIIDPSFEHLDTLNFLVDRDKKLQKTEALKHTYFLAGGKNWEEKANHILELYYKQSLGKELNEEDKKLLEESNFKYNYEHLLENLDKAGFHL
jgi:predicted Rossmann-fold nucleotide-binding protein